MNIPLQEWISNHKPAENMIYKDAALSQMLFVRDTIPKMLCDTYELYRTIQDNITVISTHFSKSIELPVYCMKASGATYILRNNFHDWKISVNTGVFQRINFKELGIFDTSAEISGVYCEGFKREWVYGSYDKDQNKFTAEINDNFNLQLFF